MSDAQHFEDRLARQLRSYAAAGAPRIERDAASRAVAAGVASRRVAPWRLRWPVLRRPMLPQAALVGVVVLASVIGFALWTGGNNQVVSPGRSPAAPSPVVTSVPTIGPGSVLTWSTLDVGALGLTEHTSDRRAVMRVAWIDDRFVLADQALGEVLTSSDGATWDVPEEGSRDLDYYEPMVMDLITSWQDEVVGWSIGSNALRIVRPPNEARTYEFEGSIGAAGIGRAGIVVRTHSTLNFDNYITSLMGSGWVDHMTSFSFTDGILRITTDDGRELEIVWAAHGFEPGDVADRGFGWHSLDGEQWAAIPEFPDNVEEIVGVEDGFIARGREMLYSTDGLAWDNIGPYARGSLVPWMGGALVASDESKRQRFDLWTSDGPRRLPIVTKPVVSSRTIGTGPLGLVSFENDDMILHSPDGIDWNIAPMPEDMASDATGRTTPTVAVGERSVVILVWRDELDESRSPSLWLGTIEP